MRHTHLQNTRKDGIGGSENVCKWAKTDSIDGWSLVVSKYSDEKPQATKTSVNYDVPYSFVRSRTRYSKDLRKKCITPGDTVRHSVWFASNLFNVK